MRHNLIFINVDQMSALDSVHAMGSKYVDTPALDRLCANGRIFSKSYSADPVCCPARTAWWTGRYPSEHGVSLNNTPAHEDMNEEVLSAPLREAGVKPYFVGKWHAPGLDVRRHFHVLHEAGWWGELTDRDIASSACVFFDSYSGDEPFFLNLGFMNPHDICISPCNDLGRSSPTEDGQLTVPYLDEKILDDADIPPLPDAFDYSEPEPHLQWAWNRDARNKQQAQRYDELTWRLHRYNYHRWVEMVDREIGVVLDALENSRFRDNTWILFTSDHGEGMSRHHLIGKGYFYREIVEVPMVLATLGDQLPVAKGTVDTEHFVSGIDVAATVCDSLGADASRYPHGRSLLPLATGGKTGSWRKTVYAECAFSSRMVYDGRYKYIRDYRIEDEDFRAPGPNTHAVLLEQLFDLHEDPAESINLADRPDHAEILEALRTVMDQKERSLKRRPIPGTPGRNWIQNKLEICKQEEMFSCTAKPFIPTPDSPLKSVLKTC